MPKKLGGQEHMSINHLTASVVQEVQEAKPHKFLGKYREKHQRQCYNKCWYQ